MRFFSWRFVRVWQRNRDVFLRLWRSEMTGFVLEPIIIIWTMGVGLGALIGSVNNESYIKFLAPGIIASYAMFSATFECTYGSFIRMEYQKTYDAIIATPLNVEDVIAGEISWAATRSLLTGTSIMIIAAIFRLVPSPWALLIIPLSGLQGFMFGSIALFFTSRMRAIYSFNYFFTLFVTPMSFFSGVYFPLSQFPPVIQTLAWVLPLTPVTYITRALVNGNMHFGLLWPLVLVLAVGAIFFTAAMLSMRRRLTV